MRKESNVGNVSVPMFEIGKGDGIVNKQQFLYYFGLDNFK